MITRRSVLAGVIGTGVVVPFAARAQSAPGVIKLGNGVHYPDASWDGMEVWCDCTAPSSFPSPTCFFQLPPANTLPVGWRIRVRKSDPTANGVEIKTTVPGDRLNHFWTVDCMYGLYLNMTQQVVEVTCDGSQDYVLTELSRHRGSPQSQRSVTIPFWPITPMLGANEIFDCNVQAAGGNIWLAIDPVERWCPPSPQTGGNYHAFTFWIRKVDSGPGLIAVGGAVAGMRINPSNDPQVTGYDRGYYYIRKQWETVQFYLNASGVFVLKA